MTSPQPAIAIILARAGSKGLPRKNALPIAGRACIEWTIDDALEAKTVGTIILSTDDEDLMHIGERRGLTIIPRAAHLATDTATIDAAARSALTTFEGSGPPSQNPWHCPAALGGAVRSPQAHDDASSEDHPLSPSTPIILLYANVPIRPPNLIDRAVQLLIKSNADSVQSYTHVGKHHPWWTARVNSETGEVRPWEGEVLNHGVFRRQDLPPAFIPDGGVLVVTREALMLELPNVPPGPHAFFGRHDRRRGLINREGEVIDIDTRTDLLVADAMLRQPPP